MDYYLDEFTFRFNLRQHTGQRASSAGRVSDRRGCGAKWITRCYYSIYLKPLSRQVHDHWLPPPDFTIMAGYSFGEHTLELHS